MRLLVCLALLVARPAAAVICDGSETICLDLTSEGAVVATGGVVVGGSFTDAGFMPSDGGGIDWPWGPTVGASAGAVEFDVTGLVPVDGEEGAGGKVSMFDMCSTVPGDQDYLGLQKMPVDYHEGHNFRYGLDDDQLADNWDAVVITSADMGCYYDIDAWLPSETHHFRAEWSPDGIKLQVDGFSCTGYGNGDGFDTAEKVFTLANRCQHYSNQQAQATFSSFRLWITGQGEPPPPPPPAASVTCDGSELLCLDLASQAAVEATGGVLVGGTFSAGGFMPSDGGGIDWPLGPAANMASGAIEMDVVGLLPSAGGELEGGKVSFFEMCPTDPGDTDLLSLQKMPADFYEGHVLRYMMNYNPATDAFDATLITSADFGCYFDIDAWKPGEKHHLRAEWSPSSISVHVDGFTCTKPGTGSAFDAAAKVLTLANRCKHHSKQQALATFTGLRVWAAAPGPPPPPPPDPGPTEPPDAGPAIDEVAAPSPDTAGPPLSCELPLAFVSIDPASGSGSGEAFRVRVSQCPGAVQAVRLALADAISDSAPRLEVAWQDGTLSLGGASCAPGAGASLTGPLGALDCAASAATWSGGELEVTFALGIDQAAFAGKHALWVSADGGAGQTLGWAVVGDYTVAASEQGEPGSASDASSIGDASPLTAPRTPPEVGSSGGCEPSGSPGRHGAWIALLLLGIALRHRRQKLT